MNFGMILIWLAFLTGLGATALSIAHNISGRQDSSTWSKKMEVACAISTTLAILVLVAHLLRVNASYYYVYSHSSTDLAWYYRISALWAGQEGSLLLWAWAILVILLLVQYTGQTRKLAGTKLMNITRMASLGIASVFLLILVLKSPFATYTFAGADIGINYWDPFVTLFEVPYGQGMNPLLRNPWMAIHPPVLFLGYAAFTIPFAAAVAALLTKDNRWTEIAGNWMRIAWLFLTLGIGLGGFWAYEVLGWGAWYWSWDPVETSSLIPWITATAFLHARTRTSAGEYGFLAPLLAIVSFILVVFATFVTRSGMWASVHSWQDFSMEGMVIAIFLVLLVGSSAFLLAKRYL
jgi:cytochrome c-type biogenesis protein CcmF